MEKYITELPGLSCKPDSCLLFEHFINRHLDVVFQFYLFGQAIFRQNSKIEVVATFDH